MAIYDVSVAIRPGMVVWPGDPAPTIVALSERSKGAAANVSHLTLSTHTGTHVDAPDHFVEGGRTVDQVALERMMGPCHVLRIASELGQPIQADDLARVWPQSGAVRVLLKTANSQHRLIHQPAFRTDFVALSEGAARYLIEQGVMTVGIDYYSIEPFQTPGHPTHGVLLSQDVLVIEGLDLTAVAPGAYRLACLPLRLVASDGAPVRVLLEDGV